MNTDKYTLGVYVEGGRLWPHVDCYGLVLEVRRDLGLPAWPEWSEMRKADGGFVRACEQMIQCAVTSAYRVTAWSLLHTGARCRTT